MWLILLCIEKLPCQGAEERTNDFRVKNKVTGLAAEEDFCTLRQQDVKTGGERHWSWKQKASLYHLSLTQEVLHCKGLIEIIVLGVSGGDGLRFDCLHRSRGWWKIS